MPGIERHDGRGGCRDRGKLKAQHTLRFILFLSVTLGIPFHEVRQWSAAEILLYQCYYRLEPWGAERDDIRTAQQTAFVASATGVTKEGGDKFTIEDFMLFRNKPDQDESKSDGGRTAFAAMFGRKK